MKYCSTGLQYPEIFSDAVSLRTIPKPWFVYSVSCIQAKVPKIKLLWRRDQLLMSVLQYCFRKRSVLEKGTWFSEAQLTTFESALLWLHTLLHFTFELMLITLKYWTSKLRRSLQLHVFPLDARSSTLLGHKLCLQSLPQKSRHSFDMLLTN